VREHIGGIYDFLQKKQIESLNDLGRTMNSAGSPSAETSKKSTYAQSSNEGTTMREAMKDANLTSKAQSLLSYAELKERNKLLKKAEKAVEAAEQKIEKLEQEIATLETKLATPEGASDTSLFTKYGELKAQLAATEDEWAEKSEELEQLKNEG